MEEPTVEEMIQILHLECPCYDEWCDGVWVSREEANAIIRKLRESAVSE